MQFIYTVFRAIYLDEDEREFKMDFVALTKVSSTKSEIVMQSVESILKVRGIDIRKTTVSCLDGTNSG